MIYISPRGIGGFLNPPGHAAHNWSESVHVGPLMAIGEYGVRLIMACPVEATVALAVFAFGCMGYAAVRLSGK